MSNILEVNKVVKQYGDYTALNEVSLTVPKGSIYGLLGPNGAGKTSLIRIINQITMPDGGQIILDGEKLKPEHVSFIGYMPEERGLYKTMKVGEQCLYLAQLKGLSKQDAKKQLEDKLREVKKDIVQTKKRVGKLDKMVSDPNLDSKLSRDEIKDLFKQYLHKALISLFEIFVNSINSIKSSILLILYIFRIII
jgi:ABC-type uncharacterized transport system ATPase subunit